MTIASFTLAVATQKRPTIPFLYEPGPKASSLRILIDSPSREGVPVYESVSATASAYVCLSPESTHCSNALVNASTSPSLRSEIGLSNAGNPGKAVREGVAGRFRWIKIPSYLKDFHIRYDGARTWSRKALKTEIQRFRGVRTKGTGGRRVRSTRKAHYPNITRALSSSVPEKPPSAEALG